MEHFMQTGFVSVVVSAAWQITAGNCTTSAAAW